MIKKFVENNQYNLYFIGRIFAIFIFGPLLIYKGKYYKDFLLILFGILLILWDGIKLVLQLNY